MPPRRQIFPPGIKFGPWTLYKEPQRGKEVLSIKRVFYASDTCKPRYQRYPAGKYKHLRHEPERLEQFARRLNLGRRAQEIPGSIASGSIINTRLLRDYYEYLIIQTVDTREARREFSSVRRHFIDFFLRKLGLKNPTQWHRVHQTKWAEYLLGPSAPKSPLTKRDIIQASNRFLRWLHGQYPGEVPAMKFEPLSRARIREYQARRVLNGEERKRRPIRDEDWKIIQSALPSDIRPFVLLAYHYGLRRSETLGFDSTSAVRNDILAVKKQLNSFTMGHAVYGPCKTRRERSIPHWLEANPKDTYRWIIEGLDRRMHQDVLSHRWLGLMKSLGLDYKFHELRHTWITRTRARYNAREVQLAAGHANITTTERYSHDHRKFDERAFEFKVAS